MSRKTLKFFVIFAAIALWFPFSLRAEAVRSLHHDLNITLHPSEHRLSGSDRVTVDAGAASSLLFHLSLTASVHGVSVSGEKRAFTFKNGQLLIPLQGDDRRNPLILSIEFSASFRDPVPDTFANSDNPGYGVTGIISERGTFLQAGAGWYPEIEGSSPFFRLRVEAPSGILAVTSGRCLGHTTQKGKSFSEWETGFPSEGLSLSAGSYRVEEMIYGRIPVATYFFPESASLSHDYLHAAGRYLALYEEWIGPYPFHQFSIVENFFPTGYGFPSYTLLGSTVIRLPFILETSLGHEIAHCWWGNGVRVDYRQGNWCEGLTTYLADHWYKERVSPEESREYRLQILRNFTTFVTPDKDFPLSQFKGRYDPSSQAIGYGKAAMVFHMVRRAIGDQAFWDGLRDVFKDKLFKEASWKDFQIAFERRAGISLESFFDQWIFRKGAPRFRLQNPSRDKEGASWAASGTLLQQEPFYDLTLPLRLASSSGIQDQAIRVKGRETGFRLDSQHKPFRLELDPECDIMRTLSPAEIPPSVNSLKGSSSVLLVVQKASDSKSKEVAGILAEFLGFKKSRILSEDQLNARELRDHDVLFLGLPESGSLPLRMPEGVVLQEQRFTVNGGDYDRPSDSFFGVFPSSAHEERVVAVFQSLSGKHAPEVAKKITHYGRYSYLVFREGRNEAKGTWPATESPMVYEWEKK